MKPVSALLYEIESIQELHELPNGHLVLQYDKLYHFHHLLEVGKDKFSADTKRYVYLLLEAPKLPAVVLPT